MIANVRKQLFLTKKEQETIRQLHNILDNDNQLTLTDVWDLLTDIACMNENDEKFMSTAYGYDVRIVD